MNTKDVVGFPGYIVSDDGRVFSTRWPNGRNKKRQEPRELAQMIDEQGRRFVTLRRNGYTHSIRVHRIVLEAFVGPKPDGMIARHGAAGVSDNSVNNLCWGTQSENNGPDKMQDGTLMVGEKNHNTKITADVVLEIRKTPSHVLGTELAKKYNITPANISAIRNYKTWKHLREK